MLRDIKVLHLESTDVCQAACPLCARETDPEFRKDQQHHLDMYKIMQVFDADRIVALDKMFMCGNYGDPAAGKHSLNIYREFRKLNPSIVLGMNTNGGIQNELWWDELGRIFNQPQDYVVFSIDGLSDTNHVYRQGVSWDKVVQNAQAFIAAGGSAHWDMLVYKHNQHQINECKELAKTLGFKWFRTKASKRPLANNLQRPDNWVPVSFASGPIDCHILKEQSVYIDAHGRISPCCWLGSTQHPTITTIDPIKLGWDTPACNPICKATCTKNNQSTAFKSQWQQEFEL